MITPCFHVAGARFTRDRHVRDCNLSGCPGCQPCTERHCQICDREHVTVDGRGSDQTCALCIAKVRAHLAGVWSKSARMLGEAIMRGIRGVNTSAANLAGPTASPETWGYRRMSVLAGRVDPEWLTAQGKTLADEDDPHPMWVLGTWEHQVRLHLNQLRDPDQRSTLTEARDYLGEHLGRLAHDPEFDFAAMAADLERCHDHLESVLAEDDHPDTGAPCPVCGRAELVKDYGTEPEDDVMWHCPRCDNWWTDGDYRGKILNVYEGIATALTVSQISRVYRIEEETVRSWAKRGKITPRGRDSSRRRLYDVAQALEARDEMEREKTRRAAKNADPVGAT